MWPKTPTFYFLLMLWEGEGNGTPLQYSCLENPRDRGAWWAAIYGVAQSWTQLKRLSSSFGKKKWAWKFQRQKCQLSGQLVLGSQLECFLSHTLDFSWHLSNLGDMKTSSFCCTPEIVLECPLISLFPLSTLPFVSSVFLFFLLSSSLSVASLKAYGP